MFNSMFPEITAAFGEIGTVTNGGPMPSGLAGVGGSLISAPLTDGVRLPAPITGEKKDAGKPPVELLSPIAVLECTRVLAFGAKKYAPNNWRGGIPFSKVVASILRHSFRRMCGEVLDPETGISHAAAIMCEAMFLAEFEITKPELDDTYKYNNDEERSRVMAYLESLFPTPPVTK